MTSYQVEYFLALAKLKNFTSTAQELHVSQPAISKQIASLEAELGIQLFIRSKHSVILTAAGEYLFKWFGKTLDDYNNALHIAERLDRRQIGKLSVGTLVGLGRLNIPSAIRKFIEKNPQSEVVCDSFPYSTLLKGLRSRKYDIIVCFDQKLIGHPEFSTQLLYRSHHVVVYSEHNRFSGDSVRNLEDLRNTPFILPADEDRTIVGPLTSEICQSCGFEPCRFITASNISSLFDLILSSSGAALVDWNTARGVIEREGEDFKYLNTGLDSCIVAAWRKDNTSTLVSEFVEYLVSAASEREW